ncbi:MAG: zinc carboxypeptidase [Bernardetiaceae bacterium]|nr:zinc carboxypeptidase [Bernardetiaceae bacterium]
MKKLPILCLLGLFLALASGFGRPALAQADYFYPGAGRMNPAIPTPEQFLGYPLGSHHTRYDQVVAYFKELDRLSDRATFQVIGQTYEQRPLVVLTVTSPAHHARLDDIRQKHLQRYTSTAHDAEPLIVEIAANVHGNEPSGGESTLLSAYYLVASETEETLNLLNNLVVHIEPVQNPDGRDRFNNWANMHRATPTVADPLDREHNEVWPGGRMNHYWFDPNRDWFLLVHPEAQARARFIHQWRPYVVVDHHEMGTNSTFYFDPGKPTSNNPIVPSFLYDNIYPKFGEYFAKAMNGIGSMYFTREVFDKLYPGYGSDYINFYGGAGFLFEQASSRGHVQETTTGTITLAFTIRNQFQAALATLRASVAEKAELLKMRRDFARNISDQAKKSPVKGYVFGDAADATRTHALVNLCLQHQVEVFELEADLTLNSRKFTKGRAFVVPTDQPSYLLVRSLFEKAIPYADSLFYDASAWSVVHAMNLPHAELRGPFTKGTAVTAPKMASPAPVAKSNYAYIIDWTDYNAMRAAYHLLAGGAVVQSAFKPFTINVGGASRSLGYGTLVLPVQQQSKITADSLHRLLQRVAAEARIEVISFEGGLASQGIDLGSNYVRTLKKPEALMVVGPGVSAYEAGEVWHLLDRRLALPITKAEATALPRANLNRYNTIVMVSGLYNFDKPTIDRLKTWVQAGGTLITFKTATEWAIRNGLAKEKLVPPDTAKGKTPLRVDYDNAINTQGVKNIGGIIVEADLDPTHPVGFGLTERKMPLYRNGLTFLKPSESPFNTVGQYTASPLIGGFVSKDNLKKLANSAALIVSGEGQGRVVLFADNPNFRGIWYGTNRLFLNALLLGSTITVPSFDGNQE